MIVVALGLLLIGVFDLVRRGTVDRPKRRAGIFVALAAAVVIAGGFVDGWTVWIIVPVAAAVLWIWTMPDSGRGRWGLRPVVALALLAGIGVWAGEPVSSSPSIVGFGTLVTLTLPEVLLVVGAVVFLLESSNIVVRVALLRDRDDEARAEADRAETPSSARSRRGWRLRRSPEPPVPPSPPLPVLKGGRIIGPLERLLMTTLVLAGGYVLIAALIAAKGIVRFPEISRDSAGGNRAEYFLVGSMVSWTIAFGTAGLVWFAVIVSG